LSSPPDSVAVDPLPAGAHPAWWLGAYGLVLAGVLALGAQWMGWSSLVDLVHSPKATFPHLGAVLKLTVMAVYLSLSTTFFPLPTGWMIAALAARETAVAASLWPTVLLVALVGGAASTVANLNDYHVFSWMLRLRYAARVRRTRTCQFACRWFDRRPFFLLVLFNLLPLPIDVVRMLAAARRYPRGSFAVANFVGRFVRYGLIAFVTYYWNLGWIAVVALLGLAVALGGGKAALWALRRRAPQPA